MVDPLQIVQLFSAMQKWLSPVANHLHQSERHFQRSDIISSKLQQLTQYSFIRPTLAAGRSPATLLHVVHVRDEMTHNGATSAILSITFFTMAETGQIRILRDPKRATNLHLTTTVTLITPTPCAPDALEKIYYQSKFHSVPLSLLLDPGLDTTNLVGHTATPLTEAGATLLPNSLHISVPQESFHTLGLPASRRHAPPQSIPPSRRCFVPVCLNFPMPAKSLSRARWALSADRFQRFDVVLSAGSGRVKPPAGATATEMEVVRRTRRGRMNAPRLGDDDDVWESVENAQSVGTRLENGDADVWIVEYRGLCNAELMQDCVRVGKDVARESGWAAVIARAPATPVVWRNGISRGGFAQGFGGDAAEVFVCTTTTAVLVQLRAGLDVT